MLSPFGEWVRAFREKNKITLREMARTLNKSPSFLSALELGRKSTPGSIVQEIVKNYDLKQEEISELEKSVLNSRHLAKLKFENRSNSDLNEMALLFARNFDKLTEDQGKKIRSILEEDDE